ncbi:MAG: 1-aminocyclopropane-1-carboxylate deaminase/D-cysteine desulfhydrase [Ilumatobacter sp.]|uniref:1-aminocyclopropane-1-carboxylate deaminase/D-cysteine desulfhydrase n=1 Tax=Ilumatobacter sp. TaxID=1967498 RepID=UPI0039192B7B
MFDHLPKSALATLPTPLEAAAAMPGSAARLWVKRDDLTGLGGGGNKARKLDFLCGDALARGAKALVTVGAAQSNHCRMTAAAGARLGLEVHLVVSGDAPSGDDPLTGNQLLSRLFGAQIHYTGAHHSHWGELEIAREALTASLVELGLAPYSIPIGGSTPVGALGYAAAFVELSLQCEAARCAPRAVVVTSSSGGTHAGLLAGRAAMIAAGHLDAASAPDIVAVGVAKGVVLDVVDVADLANRTLAHWGVGGAVAAADVEIDGRWMGDDYAVPTDAGDEAIRWGAIHNGLLTDRTYSGKGLSGLLGHAAAGRWGDGDDVVFVHTGGWPALFAADGAPDVTRPT